MVDDDTYIDTLGRIDALAHALMLLVATLEEQHGFAGSRYTRNLAGMFPDQSGTVRLDASRNTRTLVAGLIDEARECRRSSPQKNQSQNHQMLPGWVTDAHRVLIGQAMLQQVLSQRLGAKSLMISGLGAMLPCKTPEESYSVQDLVGWLDELS